MRISGILKNVQPFIFKPLPVASQYIIKRHDELNDLIKTSSYKVDTSFKYSPENKHHLLRSIILEHLKDVDIQNLTERETEKYLHYKRNLIEEDLKLFFGQADKNGRVYNEPCTGCGANLQSKDEGLSGYVPPNIWKNAECQRCTLLTKYNYPIDVNVSKEQYNQMLQKIKAKPGLVILLVDAFDMRNSVKQDILELIGDNKCIYLVGNKVDLLPKDASNWLRRIKSAIKRDILEWINLKQQKLMGISLVSAKTGFGIESLITKLQMLHKLPGHVYLVGSVNAGKSTLFNTLLHSDYSRGIANQIINRATISPWPGTTLDLLKFPIDPPHTWKLNQRAQRIAYMARMRKYIESTVHKSPSIFSTTQLSPFYSQLINEALAISKSNKSYTKQTEYNFENLIPGEISLISGSQGKAITHNATTNQVTLQPITSNNRSRANNSHSSSHCHKLLHIRESDVAAINYLKVRPANTESIFKLGKWLFDTPGLINDEQILNLLTMEEIMDVLPRETINPRTALLKPGMTLFIGGLGRIDYLDGSDDIFLTCFVSPALPLNVIRTDVSETYYETNLKDSKLHVPRGSAKRLSEFPPLVSRDFSLAGQDRWKSSCDILLSSMGFAAFTTTHTNIAAQLRVFTPAGKGLGVRTPALLPFAVIKKGGQSKVPYVYHELPFEQWFDYGPNDKINSANKKKLAQKLLPPGNLTKI